MSQEMNMKSNKSGAQGCQRAGWMTATACGEALLFGRLNTSVAADAGQLLNIELLAHGAVTNSFWQAVKRGFDEVTDLL
jgi:simple sugar transport system substrate-binding protein